MLYRRMANLISISLTLNGPEFFSVTVCGGRKMMSFQCLDRHFVILSEAFGTLGGGADSLMSLLIKSGQSLEL